VGVSDAFVAVHDVRKGAAVRDFSSAVKSMYASLPGLG
jgi:hypothetical protein